MQFDETKFKEELLSNTKIENRYDNIKAEIEKRHVVMLERKPSFFERLNDLTSSRAFKYSLATCGGLVLVAGVTLGILLPQLGGTPDVPDVKSAPIFLGVSLKEAPSNELSFSKNLNYAEELTETDSDIVLDKDSDIILDLAFDNPDEFEIDSFVVSEKEGGDKTYTTADYLEGSNFDHIYVYVGKMEESELNFKIQNITYLDGGAQRPVIMKGDNTLAVSPTPLPPPIEDHEYTISLENSEIYIDSASFLFDINDEYNMLQNMKATLYKDDLLVEVKKVTNEKELNVKFDKLVYNSDYHLEIVADITDNGEVKDNVTIIEHDFSTGKYFDDIIVTPSFVSAEVSVQNIKEKITLDSVSVLSADNALVKNITNPGTDFAIDGLNANTDYKLEFTFSLRGSHVYKETKTIKTQKYTVPSLEITTLEVSGSTVDFRYTLYDPNNIAEFSKIELYRNGEIFKTSQKDTSMFDGLTPLSNYELKVIYTYDLHEGIGGQELVATKAFEVSIEDLSVADVEYEKPAHTGNDIPIRIQLRNQSSLDVSGFVINGEEYQTTKEMDGTYLVNLDPIYSSGTFYYTITSCICEIDGTVRQVELSSQYDFEIDVIF